MSSKISSINMRDFNNTNVKKFGENFKTNKEENKKESNGNFDIKLNGQNKKRNKLLENLEKIKQNFLEQKQALIGKEMDSDEKKLKLKEINENIQNIEAQIQQMNIQQKEEEQQKVQAEIEKKKVEEEKYKDNGDERREDIIIAASLKELIQLSNGKQNIHGLKDIRNKEKIEAMYIRPEDNPTKFNYRRLAQIQKSAAAIDSRIAKEIGEINKSARAMGSKIEGAVKEKEDRENSEASNEEKLNKEEKVNS